MRIEEHLRNRILAEGPLSFHDYMDEVLYHPRLGYYSAGTPRIGIEGDFYTSSDVDPIVGKLLAKYLQEISRGFDEFTIVELGAGKGLLARDILAHHKFRYRILEQSSAMRAHQQSLLSGLGVEWIEQLEPNLTGCILSNEFYDALPVHRFVGRGGRIREIFVDENFQEVEREPSVPIELSLDEAQIVDLNLEAQSWIRRIAESIRHGFHIAIDYGYVRKEFFEHKRGTLMCYWRHQAHENPYVHVGEQDITAHVNFSDLIDIGAAAGLELVRFSTQKDFLVDLGILEEMQTLAHAGDVDSMQRLLRMKTLIVPDRMGERFKVLVQTKVR